jgi:hypothetical protein
MPAARGKEHQAEANVGFLIPDRAAAFVMIQVPLDTKQKGKGVRVKAWNKNAARMPDSPH